MSDLITSEIALLQEQIDKLEKSWYYNEQDIRRLTSPLRFKLSILKLKLCFYKLGQSGRSATKAISDFNNQTENENPTEL